MDFALLLKKTSLFIYDFSVVNTVNYTKDIKVVKEKEQAP